MFFLLFSDYLLMFVLVCPSHPISKGAPSHPTEKANFGRLYPGSCPFGHDPKLMTIGESRNVD